ASQLMTFVGADTARAFAAAHGIVRRRLLERSSEPAPVIVHISDAEDLDSISCVAARSFLAFQRPSWHVRILNCLFLREAWSGWGTEAWEGALDGYHALRTPTGPGQEDGAHLTVNVLPVRTTRKILDHGGLSAEDETAPVASSGTEHSRGIGVPDSQA